MIQSSAAYEPMRRRIDVHTVHRLCTNGKHPRKYSVAFPLEKALSYCSGGLESHLANPKEKAGRQVLREVNVKWSSDGSPLGSSLCTFDLVETEL